VKEWAGTGLLAGITFITLSLFENALNAFKRYQDRKAAAATELREREDEAREVLSNLETLDHLENQALLLRLTNGQERFEVIHGSYDWRLLHKGALISVRELGNPTTVICKIHPAIIDRRETIVTALKQKFGTGKQLTHLK
jgi:hypothetical protein